MMAFSASQARQLKAKLAADHVKSRTENGATLSYIEGWYAISEANRIFGYDAWDRVTASSRCVWTGRSTTHPPATGSARPVPHPRTRSDG